MAVRMPADTIHHQLRWKIRPGGNTCFFLSNNCIIHSKPEEAPKLEAVAEVTTIIKPCGLSRPIATDTAAPVR